MHEIHDVGIQDFAFDVNDCEFASVSEARINGQHNLSATGWRQKEVLQILAEYLGSQ